MTVTTTTRMGLIRWSSNDDEFNRDQLDVSHANIEARASRFERGSFGSRPSAGPETDRMFWLASDQGDSNWRPISYSDGTRWYDLNSFGPAVPLTVGNASTEGNSYRVARANHTHELPGWGSPVQVGTNIAPGTANAFARADHVHMLSPQSVTAGCLAPGSIDSGDLFAPGILGSTNLEAGSVTRDKLQATERIPVGAIMPFAGTSAPIGWLLCDGGSYSQTQYAALYAVCGSRFGSSGANFNVPNLTNGRFPTGAGGSYSAGSTGGATSVTLTTSNMPSHNHGITVQSNGHVHSVSQGGQHSHTIGSNTSPGFTYQRSGGNGSSVATIAGPYEALNINTTDVSTPTTHNHTISGGDHDHTASCGNAGSGTSFSIMPPYLAINWIIKY